MMLTGQNGILNRAGQSKETTEDARIDEMVKMSVMEALTNGNGRITEALLREALNKNLGSGKYTLTGNETDGWTIVANGKTYKVDANGTITSNTNGGSTGGNTGDVPAADTPVTNPASYGENPNAQATADGAGKYFPKPAGGKYVEGTVDTGVVIDINGSEFVWVPVDDVVLDKNRDSELPRPSDFEEDKDETESGSSSYNNGSGDKAKKKQDHSKLYTPMAVKMDDGNYKGIAYYYYKDYVWLKYPDSTNYYNSSEYHEPGDGVRQESGKEPENEQENYNKMIASVIKYGGFYIARYEAGIDENSKLVFKDASNPENKVITVNGESIKSNTNGSGDEISITKNWKDLYEGFKELETDSVTSEMMWGSQYDAMINWMRKTESDIMGNAASSYSSTIRIEDDRVNNKYITGYNKNDQFNHIFDLYGGCNEWTQESSRADRTGRGITKEGYPDNTLNRTNAMSENGYQGSSSRATLYIK